MVATGVLKRGLPSLKQDPTASATSGSSNSKATFAVPTITPPSIAGNPHILGSSRPSGTVFIAVGSIVGFILAAIVTTYVVSAYISHSNAKKQRYISIDNEFNAHVNGGSGRDAYDSEKSQFFSDRLTPPLRSNHNMVRLLDSQNNSSKVSQVSTNRDEMSELPQEPYSTLQGSAAVPNRRSLFISPTVEVVNQQRRNMMIPNPAASSSSLVSEPSPELNRPERAASPERKKGQQTRQKSNLSTSVASSSNKRNSLSPVTSQAREVPLQRPNAPSMYLEKLLDDD
ncbi:LAFA_0F21088g1_1 [Lachancea sp. 'fantastica']|nr:LAFA_0F21088g1_1 [Lachancea sp. 'fantastica']